MTFIDSLVYVRVLVKIYKHVVCKYACNETRMELDQISDNDVSLDSVPTIFI